MKKFFCLSCLGALLAAVLGWGCVSVERSYPDKRFFVLDVTGLTARKAAATDGALLVAPVRISPRYESRNFVYRRGDLGYESDFYNEFLVSPSALITEEVRRALAQAGLFHYVIATANPVAPSHTLESSVNALYGDFRVLNDPKAVIEMEFFLTREAPGQGEIIFHKRYQEIAPVAGRTPEALVQGWNQALSAIFKALVSDLAAVKL